MPMSPSDINVVNIVLLAYKLNKKAGFTGLDDSTDKKNKIDIIMFEMAIAMATNATDEKWIEIILSICKTADEAQHKNGLLSTHYSEFTEALYFAAHHILRKIDKKILSLEIQKENQKLVILRKKYIDTKDDNNKLDVINGYEKEIDECIIRLAHLGDKTELIKEIALSGNKKSLFFQGVDCKPDTILNVTEKVAGYQYSIEATVGTITHVNTNLPLVLLHEGEVFERIYFARHINGKIPQIDPSKIFTPSSFPQKKLSFTESTGSSFSQDEKTTDTSPVHEEKTKPSSSLQEQKDEKFDGITEEYAEELRRDLTNYAQGKTHGFDINLKMGESYALADKIVNYAKRKASPAEWLNLIIEIGEDAHNAQIDDKLLTLNGKLKVCSGYTEVLSLVRFKLLAKIQERAPQALELREQRELQNFADCQAETVKAIWDNKTTEEEEIKQKKIIRHLAYLGNVDLLLELKAAERDKIFYGTSSDSPSYNPLNWVAGALTNAITGTKIFGYEYSTSKQPYGLNGKSKICTHLPLCIQSRKKDKDDKEEHVFIRIYRNKYHGKIKLITDANTAADTAETVIKEITARIEELNQDVRVAKLIELQNSNEQTLSAFNINQKTITEEFAPKITELVSKIQGTHTYIETNTGNKKSQLAASLAMQNDRMSKFTNALSAVQKTLKKAKIENEQALKQSEIKAEQQARSSIQDLAETISNLTTLANTIPLIEGIADAESLERYQVSISGLLEELVTVDQKIVEINKLIATAGETQRVILTTIDLKPEIEKLDQLKRAVELKSKAIEQAVAEPLLPESPSAKLDKSHNPDNPEISSAISTAFISLPADHETVQYSQQRTTHDESKSSQTHPANITSTAGVFISLGQQQSHSSNEPSSTVKNSEAKEHPSTNTKEPPKHEKNNKRHRQRKQEREPSNPVTPHEPTRSRSPSPFR